MGLFRGTDVKVWNKRRNLDPLHKPLIGIKIYDIKDGKNLIPFLWCIFFALDNAAKNFVKEG